jgi:hypothetical protein
MKRIALLLHFLACLSTMGATVSFNDATGRILQPTNFFQLHVIGSSNLIVTPNPTNGSITLSVTNVASSSDWYAFLYSTSDLVSRTR